MKDTVHRDYLKALEAKQNLPELPWGERTVLVIGSNGKNNVGAAVSKAASMVGANVIEADKFDCKLRNLTELVNKATDLVICCAGVHMNWIENAPLSAIEEVIWDSLTAPIQYTAIFAQAKMHAPHRKHIVFIGSMAHRKVLNASSSYCAAKAGLAHFAQCMAWELTPKGFTIGIVHPGNIEGTPMTEDTIQGISEYRNLDMDAAREYWGSVRLTDRWLNVDDVAWEVMNNLMRSPHYSGAQVELGGGMR